MAAMRTAKAITVTVNRSTDVQQAPSSIHEGGKASFTGLEQGCGNRFSGPWRHGQEWPGGTEGALAMREPSSTCAHAPAWAVCRRAGYRQMVSHWSGASARGERVAKYNRLIEIAAAAPGLRYGMPRPAGT